MTPGLQSRADQAEEGYSKCDRKTAPGASLATNPFLKMTEPKTIGHLNSDTPFNHIFGNQVPIRSIIPIRPRDENAPLCYVVDAKHLSTEQIGQLAQMLYEMWQPECKSIAEAIAYIQDGLPLNCEYFSSVSCSDPGFFFTLIDNGDPLLREDKEDWREENNLLEDDYER